MDRHQTRPKLVRLAVAAGVGAALLIPGAALARGNGKHPTQHAAVNRSTSPSNFDVRDVLHTIQKSSSLAAHAAGKEDWYTGQLGDSVHHTRDLEVEKEMARIQTILSRAAQNQSQVSITASGPNNTDDKAKDVLVELNKVDALIAKAQVRQDNFITKMGDEGRQTTTATEVLNTVDQLASKVNATQSTERSIDSYLDSGDH